MAMFYSTSSNHVRDPDALISGSMLYFNYPLAGGYTDMLAGNNQSQNVMSQSLSTGAAELLSWRGGRNGEMLMETTDGPRNGSGDIIRDPLDDPHMAYQNINLQHSNIQGLSLSLGTQIPLPPFSYCPSNTEILILNSHLTESGNGFTTFTSTISNSKYLKAAQELLDEVVNVHVALKSRLNKNQSFNSSGGRLEGKDDDGISKSEAVPFYPQQSTDNSSIALLPSGRQDLLNKITKLLAMLDEVDRRFKQYYYQMQLVVASFDNIAGNGAAKPYTTLALQTISEQFRCLRDAITGQIRSTRKNLGEENSGNKGCGLSRLRHIDQQIRQQRAMQQLGLQPHAWRPQRGLPENSVTILRAWLFEHFLHPYPKDSEKLMLARQTGLTRSQVSNWFINARVRLWKPMIEDMYKEEIGDAETDSNSSSGNALKYENKSSEDTEDMQSSAAERSNINQPNNNSSTSNLMPEPSTSLLCDVIDHTNISGTFMAYHQIAEFGKYANAGVSLTLGLQHPDGVHGSQGQQNFLSVRGEEMYDGNRSLGADSADYDCMNLINSRQRFQSSQMLHDFVA